MLFLSVAELKESVATGKWRCWAAEQSVIWSTVLRVQIQSMNGSKTSRSQGDKKCLWSDFTTKSEQSQSHENGTFKTELTANNVGSLGL